MLHVKVAGLSVDVKEKLGEELPVDPEGPDVIVVSGAVESST
jgi:hypothetical protein